MTEAEARNLLSCKKGSYGDPVYAEGYLEALEKAKPLIEVLKKYITCDGTNCEKPCCGKMNYSGFTKLQDAFVKYEAEK